MALIKCPKCKHEISDTTKKCIHCKTKVKSNNNTLKINYKLVIPISIISLFLIISFIVYKIDDNKIHYNDKKQNIEEVKTNDENNLNNNQEDSNNNSDIVENNANSNTNNISNNSNTSSDNNSNTNNKIIIDATENKNCPSGYKFIESLEYTDKPCQKMNIVNGAITYYCLLNNQTLEGDKCKSISTSQPVGGQCYNGAILNNGICETTTYTNASTRLTCPSGYSKYSDTQCYGWLYKSASITYSCPSGYILNGNKCEK